MVDSESHTPCHRVTLSPYPSDTLPKENHTRPSHHNASPTPWLHRLPCPSSASTSLNRNLLPPTPGLPPPFFPPTPTPGLPLALLAPAPLPALYRLSLSSHGLSILSIRPVCQLSALPLPLPPLPLSTLPAWRSLPNESYVESRKAERRLGERDGTSGGVPGAGPRERVAMERDCEGVG